MTDRKLENTQPEKTSSGRTPPGETPPGKRPLAGRRVILTRREGQAKESAALLSSLGAEVTLCPLIEISPPQSWEPLDRALAQISSYDWLIFASVNAVEYFLRRFDQVVGDRAELLSHQIAAVGNRTRDRIEREGLAVTLTPAQFTAEALVERMIEYYEVREHLRGLRALVPASQITRDVIRPGLSAFGVKVDLVEAYRTLSPNTSRDDVRALLDPERGGYLIFASPSAVTNLARLLGVEDLKEETRGLRVVCHGPATADAARRYGLTVDLQPSEYVANAVVDLIVADQLD